MALLAAYNFDDIGGTSIADRSGNGWHISLTGQPGAQVDSGGLLNAGALGKTGAGTIPLPAGLLAASETDDRTLMFDGLGGRSVWWVRWESTSLNTGVWGMLSLDAANVISRARTQANAGPSSTITVGALNATVRHNFCLTYKRSTGVLTGYYDGVQVGTATFTAGTPLYVGANSLNIAEWSSTGPAIDNLRIFNHALTSGEVAALAGTAVTAAAEEHSGAVTLAATAALTRSGVKAVAGSVPLAAAAGVGAAGTKTASGAAALMATADADPVGVHAGAHAVPLASAAGIAVVGSTARFGSVTLSATTHIRAGQAAAARNITLTASLAEQPEPETTVGVRRWTATLGEQA